MISTQLIAAYARFIICSIGCLVAVGLMLTLSTYIIISMVRDFSSAIKELITKIKH